MDSLDVSPDEAAAAIKSIQVLARSGEALGHYLETADNYRRTSSVQLLLIASAIYTIGSIFLKCLKKCLKVFGRTVKSPEAKRKDYRPLLTKEHILPA